MAVSVDPLVDARLGSLISFEGAISSALASATISERVTSRWPCSMQCKVDLLIPASQAITRNDLSRVLRIHRMRRPIVRISSASIVAA